MGKSTISMAMFNSFLYVYQRVHQKSIGYIPIKYIQILYIYIIYHEIHHQVIPPAAIVHCPSILF